MSYTKRFYELWEETIHMDMGLTKDQRISVVSILLEEENKDRRTPGEKTKGATEKQLAFLKREGYVNTNNITKDEAILKINEIIEKKRQKK